MTMVEKSSEHKTEVFARRFPSFPQRGLKSNVAQGRPICTPTASPSRLRYYLSRLYARHPQPERPSQPCNGCHCHAPGWLCVRACLSAENIWGGRVELSSKSHSHSWIPNSNFQQTTPWCSNLWFSRPAQQLHGAQPSKFPNHPNNPELSRQSNHVVFNPLNSFNRPMVFCLLNFWTTPITPWRSTLQTSGPVQQL